MKTREPIHGDTVLTNAAYPLAAIFAPTYLSGVILCAVGLYLAVASSLYHADTQERWERELDVYGVMLYVAAVAAIALAQWTPWGYLVLPVAAAAYGLGWMQYDTGIHVAAWGVAVSAALFAQVGWWALLPTALLGAAGLIKATDEVVYGRLHALWHLLSAAAAAGALWIL